MPGRFSFPISSRVRHEIRMESKRTQRETRIVRHRWTNNEPIKVAAGSGWCYAVNCVPKNVARKLP